MDRSVFPPGGGESGLSSVKIIAENAAKLYRLDLN